MSKICEFFKTDLTSACTSFAGTTASAFALGKLGVHVVAFQSAAIVSGVTATVQFVANKCFGGSCVTEGLSLLGGLALGAAAQKAVAEKLGETLDAKGLAFIAVAVIAFKVISNAVPALFKSNPKVGSEGGQEKDGSEPVKSDRSSEGSGRSSSPSLVLPVDGNEGVN